MLLLLVFMVTSADIMTAQGRALYSARKAFTAYKVQVTTKTLTIRKSTSTTAAVVGSYSSGAVVDVIGQSGSFLQTSRGYIYSAYTKAFAPSSRGSQSTAFQPYKVVINTAKLNIRTSPSASGGIAGYYVKGNVVDVTGVSGSFLKTSKGYIAVQYTQKYTAPSTGTTTPSTGTTTPGTGTTTPGTGTTTPGTGTTDPGTGTTTPGTDTTTPGTGTTPVPVFQPYKAVITTSELNIRTGPSTSYAIAGKYYASTIVDIIGESGSFLQTSLGYIAAQYAQKYNPPAPPPSRGEEPQQTGQYIMMNEDSPLLMNVDGLSDERYAVAGKKFSVYGQVNGYYKIKVGKLYGYVPESKVTVLDSAPSNKVTLGWQYVYSKASNATYYNDLSNYVNRNSAAVGMDVISPTWFYMTGDAKSPSTINAAEKADLGYVKTAHRNGYEVWALYQEFNAERANKTFYDPAVKAKVISQIVNYSLQYNVDGVNIDYEGLGSISTNKAGFTAFVKDLSAELQKVGLKVSVDVTKSVSSSIYSNFLDRPALASYTDYIIYMAYDEHYAGAKTAGSVGSFPWVEAGLKDMLNQGVPKEKLILGVPFYLRDFAIMGTFMPYDSVTFSQDGRLYSKPFEYSNKMIDVNPGYTYKYLETAGDFYKVELNGDIAYIPQSDSILEEENTNLRGVSTSLDVVLPYDSVVMKEQALIYSQPSETASIIGTINPGYAYKCIEATQDWYKIDYNGTEAYIMQKSGAFLPQFTSFEESDA
jgi:spore germination protein YaaH/SH3-like domain-containing protein